MNRQRTSLLLFILWSFSACSHPVDRQLHVIYTGSLLGYLEPCSCPVGRVGGFARLATAFADSQQHLKESCLFLDAGDFTSERSSPTDFQQRFLLRALQALKYDAINVSLADLQNLSADTLLAAQRELNLPLISANLINRTTEELLFPAYTLLHRGAWVVGVIGVARPPEERAKTALRANFEISDPVLSIQKAVRNLPTECNFVIVLCDLPARAARQLGTLIPRVDLVISCLELYPAAEPRQFGSAYVLGVSPKGERLTALLFSRLSTDSLRCNFNCALLDSTIADRTDLAEIIAEYQDHRRP